MEALRHRTRLDILECIDQNEIKAVKDIYRSLDIEQTEASRHLKILQHVGVVKFEKQGKYHKYAINYELIERVQSSIKKFINHGMYRP